MSKSARFVTTASPAGNRQSPRLMTTTTPPSSSAKRSPRFMSTTTPAGAQRQQKSAPRFISTTTPENGRRSSAPPRFISTTTPEQKAGSMGNPRLITSEQSAPSETSSDGSQETASTASSTGTPVATFGRAMNDIALISDDGAKRDVYLKPSAWSLFSSRADAFDLDDSKIATFKCESRRNQLIMGIMAGVVTMHLARWFKSIDKSPANGKEGANNLIGDLDKAASFSKDKVARWVTGFYGAVTGPLSLAAGIGIAVVINFMRTDMTMIGPRGDTHLLAHWTRHRNGYTISARGPGSENIMMKWILALDLESKTWRLSTIPFTVAQEAMVDEKRIEAEFLEELTPPSAIAAEVYERSQRVEAELHTARRASARSKDLHAGGGGGDPEVDQLMAQLALSGPGPDLSEGSETGSEGNFGAAKETQETTTPATTTPATTTPATTTPETTTPATTTPETTTPETTTPETTTPVDVSRSPQTVMQGIMREDDVPLLGPGAEAAASDNRMPENGADIAVPSGEGKELDLEFPKTMKAGGLYTDTFGGATIEVVEKKSWNFGINGRVWRSVGFGSDKYMLRFSGESSAPRDVITFATYIVRSSDAVPMAPLLIYAALTGLTLIVGMISLMFLNAGKENPDSIVKQLLDNQNLLPTKNPFSTDYLRRKNPFS